MVAAIDVRSKVPGTKAFALGALALQAWVAIALVGMHLLRPDLDPTVHRISEYAIGPFGALMRSAQAAATLAKLLLVLGLLRDGPMTWLAGWAKGLLQLAVLGLCVSFFFPMDLSGDASAASVLHDAGFLLNLLSSVIAALLLSMSFNLDPRWQPIQGRSLVLSIALAIEAVLVLRALGSHAPFGVVNRAYALTSIGWMTSTAVRLAMVARS